MKFFLSFLVPRYISHFFGTLTYQTIDAVALSIEDFLRNLTPLYRSFFLIFGAVHYVFVLRCNLSSNGCRGFCTSLNFPTTRVYMLFLGIIAWRIEELLHND